MEKLKVAIAEKILEVSADNTDDMKQKLSKIQRFNDFVEACKSLMTNYPEIEVELLQMVKNNDFDAIKASRNVDYIINREQRHASLSEDNKVFEQQTEIPVITSYPTVETAEVELNNGAYHDIASLHGRRI